MTKTLQPAAKLALVRLRRVADLVLVRPQWRYVNDDILPWIIPSGLYRIIRERKWSALLRQREGLATTERRAPVTFFLIQCTRSVSCRQETLLLFGASHLSLVDGHDGGIIRADRIVRPGRKDDDDRSPILLEGVTERHDRHVGDLLARRYRDYPW